jgi:hypothetical protein
MDIIKFKEFIILNESRKGDIKNIVEMKEVLFEDFMKIYLYIESTQYVNGWMNEIEHFISKIYEIKDGRNVYDYSIYYNNLTYKIEDDFGNINKNVLREVTRISDNIKRSCSTMYLYNDDIFTCLRLYDKFIDKLYDIILNRIFEPEKINNLLIDILDISF